MKKPLQSFFFLFALGFTPLLAQPVEVEVDLATAKHYGKVESFDRAKFINFHQMPASEFTTAEWKYLYSLNCGHGRSFMVPGAGYVVDNNTQSKLKTNGANFGKYTKKSIWYKPDMYRPTIVTSHPTPGKSANNYAFQWRGDNADYSREAEVVSDFFTYQFTDNGIESPRYYEPMNEPYVHANDFKSKGISDTRVRKEMARYHKQVAEKMHADHPDVLVGGFASAWPFFEGFDSDFQHWDERMKMFIDEAGSEMDFISIHTYDGSNVVGGETYRSGSNMEALMDIIEGYTFIKYGTPKPILISENGCTSKTFTDTPYSEQRDWQLLRAINHQAVQYMARPENLLKSIPFISGKASWYTGENPYPFVISKRKSVGSDEWEWTHLIKFFELWSDLEGDYADAESSEIDIQALSFVDGKSAYVVLNNLEEERDVRLNLTTLAGNRAEEATIKRLYANGSGVPTLEEKSFDLDNPTLTLTYGETAIIHLTYAEDIVPNEVITQKRFYASSYLKPIRAGVKNSFTLKAEAGTMKRATLKVGFARPVNKGKSFQPTLVVNGKIYPFPTDWKGYDQKSRTKEGFFGVVDVPVEVKDLREENTISLQFPDAGGTISTVALTVDYAQAEEQITVQF